MALSYVLIGAADLETLVPLPLSPYCNSSWPSRPTRSFYEDFIPLRVWLIMHRAWIGKEMVALFYEAAGAGKPDINDGNDQYAHAGVYDYDSDTGDVLLDHEGAA